MISLSVCPICSGQSFKDYLVCKDYTSSGEEFHLKQCNFCEFVLTDPKPDAQEIANYYQSEKYISHTGGRKNLFDTLYVTMRKIALGTKRRTIEKHSRGKTILDFGCGTGEFLKEMKDHYWQVTGIEPAKNANTKAALLTGSQIHSSLTEIKETTFDVITLWHVLEHIHDLNGTLHQFNSFLNDSGTIFVAVPNFESNDAEHYKSFWAAYDVPRHLWHFTKTNMKQILENNGFKLFAILPMKLDSFYVSILSEGYKNPNQSKLISLFKALMRGFFSNLKAKKKMNYSSLIYIAKK